MMPTLLSLEALQVVMMMTTHDATSNDNVRIMMIQFSMLQSRVILDRVMKRPTSTNVLAI